MGGGQEGRPRWETARESPAVLQRTRAPHQAWFHSFRSHLQWPWLVESVNQRPPNRRRCIPGRRAPVCRSCVRVDESLCFWCIGVTSRGRCAESAGVNPRQSRSLARCRQVLPLPIHNADSSCCTAPSHHATVARELREQAGEGCTGLQSRVMTASPRWEGGVEGHPWEAGRGSPVHLQRTRALPQARASQLPLPVQAAPGGRQRRSEAADRCPVERHQWCRRWVR